MTFEEVIPRERIEREAKDAARRGLSLGDACPYPWGTDAAHHFTAVFLLEQPRDDNARG